MHEKYSRPYHGGYPGDIPRDNSEVSHGEVPLPQDIQSIVADEVIPMTLSGSPKSALKIIISNVIDHNGYISDFTEEFYQQLDYYPDGSPENDQTEELIVDLVGLEKSLFDNLKILFDLGCYESAVDLAYRQQIVRISEIFKNQQVSTRFDGDYFQDDEESELDRLNDHELSQFIDDEKVDDAMRIVIDNYNLDELRMLLGMKDETLDQLYEDEDTDPSLIPIVKEFRNALALYINVHDFHAERYE